MAESQDWVAVEEPLEIRVRGTPVAVLLRTPGRDADLVAGFLAAERVIAHPEDLSGLAPCAPVAASAPGNAWNAALAEGVAFDPRERRFGVISGACGLCGVETLAELERAAAPIPPMPALGLAELQAGMEAMRAAQSLFSRTGGTHAAALWGEQRLLDCAEDVGRHNAVDKVLGARLRAGEYPLRRPLLLLVSGRIAFEIVQKAALAGVSAVAGVGAPSSFAVDTARHVGLALYGLVRPRSANRYV